MPPRRNPRRLLTALLALILTVLVVISRESQSWQYVVQGRPGQLLYAATFDGFFDDWSLSQGARAVTLTEGVLRAEIGVNAGGGSVFSPSRFYYDDISAQVKVRLVDGSELNAYGIAFRQVDDEHYYLFVVSADGWYRVDRAEGGVFTPLSAWIPSDAIRTGFNVENTLKVVAYQDRFKFYVNDTLLSLCIPEDGGESTYSVYTDPPCSGSMEPILVDDSYRWGRVALTAEVVESASNDPLTRTITAEFDDLLIYGAEIID